MKRRIRLLCALTALCLLAALLPTKTASAAEAWLWPVAGVYELARGVGPGHGGIDIKADYGTPVLATKSGTVIESSNSCPHISYSRGGGCWCNSGLGNYVKLQHDDGTYSRYLHLKQKSALPVGTHVKQGEIIGRSGSSGDSTGPHLHFDAYTADNVRFFCNPTDTRHNICSANGINYVYSVITQPSQPVLAALPQRLQLGTPAVFRWENTENTSCYSLTIQRKNGAVYESYELIEDAKSGLSRTLPAGSYRAVLRSVNKGSGNNDAVHWKTAEAAPVDFAVGDYTPSRPVLQQAQSEFLAADGAEFRWESTDNTSYYILSVARMEADGLFRSLSSLRRVSSPLRVTFAPGRYRVRLQAVNAELLDEAGEILRLHSESDWLLFDVLPDCIGVHRITQTVAQPSCTSCGSTLYTCAEDGVSWVGAIVPPLGHAWGEGERLSAGGQRTLLLSSCSRCGAIRTMLLTKARSAPCSGGGDCPAADFLDLPRPGNWAHAGIDWAMENGVTNGVDARHFCPQAETTRAQVVTFLWRAAGSPVPETAQSNPFTDVKESDFCYQAVLWAVENGITNGVTATGFDPKKPCTRAQLVTFLWRWLGCEPAADSAVSFLDLTPGSYYENAVAWAAEQGVTNGDSETSFSPDKLCTRAQAVTLLYRAVCPTQ